MHSSNQNSFDEVDVSFPLVPVLLSSTAHHGNIQTVVQRVDGSSADFVYQH